MAANRSVKVSLVSEVNGYIAGMEAASKKTRELGSEAEKLSQKRDAINNLGAGLTTIGAVAAAGVGLAISKFAEFDAAMSDVQAATHESEANMTLLRDAAIEAGASTVFSATESANAIEELSKAGVSTADILGGGLAGALDLASAGNLGVAEAAEIAATAMTQFGRSGAEVPHIADLLAAGAGKAQGSVQDLAQALKQGGLVASQAGFSIEETTGTLSAFAAAGLLGSDAGTSLKSAILMLQNPSEKAGAVMKQYGIEVYNAADGSMKSFSEIAGILEGQLGGLTDQQRNAALATIFGSDAVRAANVLYANGADGIQEWTDNVNDAGYASETAATRLDNLKGDVEALGGALDTALIQTGSNANDALRFLAQGATGLIENYSNLSPAIQGTNLALGAGVAVAGTVGGAFLLAVPKIVEFRSSIDQMGPGAQKAAGAIGALGKAAAIGAALGGAALALDKLTSANDKAAASVEKTTAALRANGGEALFTGLGQDVDSYSDALELLTGDGLNSNMERFGSTLNGALFGGGLTDQVAQTREQFDAMGQSLSGLVQGGDAERAAELFDQLAEKAKAEGVSRKQLLELMPAYSDALAGVSNEQAEATTNTDEQAAAIEALAGQAQSAEGDIDDLAEAIANFGAAQFDVNSASRDFEAAIDDATAALEKNGATLDVGTEAGRANGAALDSIASSALSMSSAIIAQTGDQEQASAAILRGREAYIQASIAAGVSEEAANAYADQLGLIPSNVSTAIGATGVTKTQEEIDAIQLNLAQTIRDLQINIRAAVDRSQLDGLLASIRTARSELSDLNGASSGSGRMGTYAVGGAIYGPGTGTSDNVPIWASNGEHMLTAEDVRNMGGHSAVYAFREGLKDGKSKYADGGAINAPVFVTAPRAPDIVFADGAGRREVFAPITVETVGGLDAETVGTITGRELGRYLAGSV